MKPLQTGVIGFAAFGTGKGLTYAGSGALAASGVSPLLAILDSAAARHGFWQRCLSVHRCGAPEDATVFTVRVPVFDTADRHGFCGVALAVKGDAVQGRQKSHLMLMKHAEQTLDGLQRRGVEPQSRRFLLKMESLQAFAEEGLAALQVNGSQALGADQTLSIANPRRSDFWAPHDVWDRVIAGPWLRLPSLSGDANHYLFSAEKRPDIIDLNIAPFTPEMLNALAVKAPREARGTVLNLFSPSRHIDQQEKPNEIVPAVAPVLPQALQSTVPLVTPQSTGSPSNGEKRRRGPRIRPPRGRDRKSHAELVREIRALREEVRAWRDARGRDDFSAVAASKRSGQNAASDQRNHFFSLNLSSGLLPWKSFGLVLIFSLLAFAASGILLLHPYNLTDRLSWRGEPGFSAAGCEEPGLRAALDQSLMTLSRTAGPLLAGEADAIDHVLSCYASESRSSPPDCRLKERVGSGLLLLRETRIGRKPSARVALREALMDIRTAADQCR